MTRNLGADLARSQGLARRADIVALGHSPGILSGLVHAGMLSSPRRGWITNGTAPANALRAVYLGGRLGGSSALASYGIWNDGAAELVIACAPTASRLPELASGEVRIWTPDRAPRRDEIPWRVSVVDALLQYASTAGRDSLIAAVDSALNTRVLSRADLSTFIGLLPRHLRSIAREVDGKSMSGTETRLRLALTRMGLRVRSQESLPNVGIVDLFVEDWLIVEVDSREYHDGRSAQYADRRRDGNAVLGGYAHERFVWAQVTHDLDWCCSVVEARLRQGPPRPPVGHNARQTFNRK